MSIAVISAVAGVVKEGFGFWKDVKKAKHTMKMAGIENRTRLLLSEQENNHEWEMKALETSSKGLKNMSFLLFAGPIIITVLHPTYGGEIWKNLELVPAGFMQIYYGITGAIWGLASLKDHGVNLTQIIGKKVNG